MKLLVSGISYLILMCLIIAAIYGLYATYNATQSAVLIAGILYVINLIFALSIFVQKRHDHAKVSWMIVMLLLPFAGHILFFIFGKRYRGRKSFAEYLTKNTFEFELPTPSSDVLMQKMSNISHRQIHDSDIQLFMSGDVGYEHLFTDLAQAKKHILLQYYIIKPGEIYQAFKAILIERAKAGVEVRLIVDDFGRWGIPSYEIKDLQKSGVKVAIFGLVQFPFIGSSNTYRSHRKVAIIDGLIVHTGGINIANEYANLNKRYGLWQDYQVKITGSAVRSFSLLFIDDWAHVTKQALNPLNYQADQKITNRADSQLVLVEDSPEITEPILQEALVLLILHAKKSVTLVTPYLVPTPELESALRTAVHAGIKVSIHIPGQPDKRSVYIGTRHYAKSLLEIGAQIYEQSDMFIHSKFGLIDDQYVYLGATNIDMRSMYSQFELLIVAKGAIVKQTQTLIDSYLATARQLNLTDFKNTPLREFSARIWITLFAPLF